MGSNHEMILYVDNRLSLMSDLGKALRSPIPTEIDVAQGQHFAVLCSNEHPQLKGGLPGSGAAHVPTVLVVSLRHLTPYDVADYLRTLDWGFVGGYAFVAGDSIGQEGWTPAPEQPVEVYLFGTAAKDRRPLAVDRGES